MRLQAGGGGRDHAHRRRVGGSPHRVLCCEWSVSLARGSQDIGWCASTWRWSRPARRSRSTSRRLSRWASIACGTSCSRPSGKLQSAPTTCGAFPRLERWCNMSSYSAELPSRSPSNPYTQTACSTVAPSPGPNVHTGWSAEAPHQGVRLALAGELRQLRSKALSHQDRDPALGGCSTYPPPPRGIQRATPETLPPPFWQKSGAWPSAPRESLVSCRKMMSTSHDATSAACRRREVTLATAVRSGLGSGGCPHRAPALYPPLRQSTHPPPVGPLGSPPRAAPSTRSAGRPLRALCTPRPRDGAPLGASACPPSRPNYY